MKFLINTKIGQTKGYKRFWIEGIRLLKAGFDCGDKLSITQNESSVKIVKSDDNNLKNSISKRKRGDDYLPLLEVTGTKLDAFESGEYVRVIITKNTIIITKNVNNQKHIGMIKNLKDRIKFNKPLRVMSLFHGGGVLDSAIHHGLNNKAIKSKVAIAIEQEAKYLNSSVKNNPQLFDDNSLLVESPIELLNAQTNSQYDIGIMGIPCTGASIAGRTKNNIQCAEQHESAGALFYYALNYAIKCPIVIIENVPQYQETISYSIIESVLKANGYTVQVTNLNGNEFGAIENRTRMCAIAIIDELIADFDILNVKPTEHNLPPQLHEILEDIPESSTRWKDFQYLIDKEIRDKANGKGFKRNLVDGSERECKTIGRLYHKCRSTETYVKSPFNNGKTRLLTPTEHAKVKTIPRSIISGCCDTLAHEILGQSIIYDCFKKVGEVIGDFLSSHQFKYA